MAKTPTPSIYALLDAAGAVRYIGKANCPASRLKSHMRDSKRRDTPLYRWIREEGLPEMVILRADCDDWAVEETALIAEYRAQGHMLLNVAKGGNQPHCPRHVRAKNAAAVAKSRVDTPRKKEMYRLRKLIGMGLRQGYATEGTKQVLRQAAIRHPHLFSEWANL